MFTIDASSRTVLVYGSRSYCGTLEGIGWLSQIPMPALQWSRLVKKVLPGIIQIVIHQLDQPEFSCAHAQIMQMFLSCEVSIDSIDSIED